MIKFNPLLVNAIFIRRFKRFFIEVEYQNELVLAHVANTGSMLSLLNPGAEVLMQPVSDPKRKLAYSIQAIKHDNVWVGVNTMLPNRLVKDALINHHDLLSDYDYNNFLSEVKYGLDLRSKVDFLLTNKEQKHFLEVKNVTLKQHEQALFPDSVSLRAQKHVHDLLDQIKQGHKASLLFIVQREDTKEFALAKNIDPHYYKLVSKAALKGLQIKALSASINNHEICLSKNLPIFGV